VRVLRLAGLNYSNLREVSLRCCKGKIINIGQCFTEQSYSENKSGTFFIETRCIMITKQILRPLLMQ